jgi:subtilisin family serine protease
MWNLRKIRWQEARGLRKFVEPESINVAVLDTGLDEQHPELRDHVARYEWLPEVGSVSSPEDIVGHGTHVAGTIVADFNNTVGIHGICQCRLNAWKIFGDTANYYRSIGYYTYVVDPVMYLRALLDCLDADMDVINLSIGGPGKPSPQEQFAFDALLANGTAIVAAMGNERASGSPTSYPAAIPGVIAVTATRPNDTIANFSSRGKHATIAAPGVSIWSTLPSYPGNSGYEANRSSGTVRQGKPLYREKDYDAWSGTSMASPHVAAATAVLLSSKGSMPVSSVEQALRDSAVKVADMRGQDFDHDFGSGRLDLESLLS